VHDSPLPARPTPRRSTLQEHAWCAHGVVSCGCGLWCPGASLGFHPIPAPSLGESSPGGLPDSDGGRPARPNLESTADQIRKIRRSPDGETKSDGIHSVCAAGQALVASSDGSSREWMAGLGTGQARRQGRLVGRARLADVGRRQGQGGSTHLPRLALAESSGHDGYWCR
jgi:hypothetical protein